MTTKQKIEMRQSPKREKKSMCFCRKTPKPTKRLTELRGLSKSMQDGEVELRAAIATETELEQKAKELEPDAELRERIELRSKASLVKFFQNREQGRLMGGPEAELQAAAKVQHGGIPLELWDVKVETRADVNTGVPTTAGVNLYPIQPKIFAHSIAMKLGVDMPRVPSGTFAIATIDTPLTAATKAKSSGKESTAATFTVGSATAKRISGRLSLTLEDIATVGQANFEAALRQNLGFIMSDKLDDQLINGTGSSNQLHSFFSRLANADAPPSGIESWSRFAAKHASGIDGLWATKLMDVAIVVNPETYRLACQTFQGTDAEDSASSYAEKNTGGFWTNKRMPAKSSHIAKALLYRKGGAAMGTSERMQTAVCPNWGELAIDDIYSDSDSGGRHYTMHILCGDLILVQSEAYVEVSYRISGA